MSQREINVDTDSYVTALRAALRQSPDVILLGEMRDYETINVAMTAAETGHLLFSTLHTIGAANTIDRIIDVFPANQQRQIAVQLSLVLNAVVSQQLVPSLDGGRVPAFEIMTVTPAIRNMIRENKVPQIDGVIYSSAKDGMISMDSSLQQLYQSKKISRETALTYATNPEMLARRISDLEYPRSFPPVGQERFHLAEDQRGNRTDGGREDHRQYNGCRVRAAVLAAICNHRDRNQLQR